MRPENSPEPSMIPEDLLSIQMRVNQPARASRTHSQEDQSPESRNFAWLDDHVQEPERWDGMA